jgi:hypothetical protein
MYKIETLGESFVFLKERDTVKYKYKGSPIIVKTDEECDFAFSFENQPLSKEDFLRAVSVYLFKVVGLPSSVYTVRTNYGKIPITVPQKREEMFGGNLIKCKLLFTESPREDNAGGVNLHTALTALGAVKIAFCDSLSDFDIERVGKMALREEGKWRMHSLVAISLPGEYLSMNCFFPDGKRQANAYSYAAAYCFARALGALGDEVRIHSADSVALCRNAFGGARVFDKTPSVTKIIS